MNRPITMPSHFTIAELINFPRLVIGGKIFPIDDLIKKIRTDLGLNDINGKDLNKPDHPEDKDMIAAKALANASRALIDLQNVPLPEDSSLVKSTIKIEDGRLHIGDLPATHVPFANLLGDASINILSSETVKLILFERVNDVDNGMRWNFNTNSAFAGSFSTQTRAGKKAHRNLRGHAGQVFTKLEGQNNQTAETIERRFLGEFFTPRSLSGFSLEITKSRTNLFLRHDTVVMDIEPNSKGKIEARKFRIIK